MNSFRTLTTAAALTASVALPFAPAGAQGYFIPHQKPAVHAAPKSAPRRTAPVAPAIVPGTQQAEEEEPLPQLPLPAVPELPKLPRGTTPPSAVIGVLGVPEVMRVSTAAQQVKKVIDERRAKLAQDAQKEQASWRDMQQKIASERSKLSAEQIRAKEKELQDKVTKAQKDFRKRNRIIQLAAQVAAGQIERTLVAVIRQVAESRGMNLVLHRAQVALNVNEFDITQTVADQLNKILPQVIIPPEGKEPTAADVKMPASVLAASARAAAQDQQKSAESPSGTSSAEPSKAAAPDEAKSAAPASSAKKP